MPVDRTRLSKILRDQFSLTNNNCPALLSRERARRCLNANSQSEKLSGLMCLVFYWEDKSDHLKQIAIEFLVSAKAEILKNVVAAVAQLFRSTDNREVIDILNDLADGTADGVLGSQIAAAVEFIEGRLPPLEDPEQQQIFDNIEKVDQWAAEVRKKYGLKP